MADQEAVAELAFPEEWRIRRHRRPGRMGLRDLAWLGHHGHGHLPPQRILGENSRGINQMVQS